MFEAEIDKWLKEEIHMKNALFKWADIMDDLGYQNFLEYGTLLGAARNQRLVPGDLDVDVLTVIGDCDSVNPENDFDIFGIVREAYKRGFKRVRFDHYYSIDYHKRGEWCKHPELLKLPLEQQTKAFLKLEKRYFVERFCVEWKSFSEARALGWIPHLDCWLCHYTLPSYQSYINYSEVKMYGRTFPACENVEERLDIYGKNWREIFCSYNLWRKYYDEIRKGVIPEEVQIFMREFKERNKLFKESPLLSASKHVT